MPFRQMQPAPGFMRCYQALAKPVSAASLGCSPVIPRWWRLPIARLAPPFSFQEPKGEAATAHGSNTLTLVRFYFSGRAAAVRFEGRAHLALGMKFGKQMDLWHKLVGIGPLQW